MTDAAVSDRLDDVPAAATPLLPLLYVAWADGVLTPSELASVRQYLDEQDWMDDAARTWVQRQLDPSDPPSATQYFRWVRTLRTAVRPPGGDGAVSAPGKDDPGAAGEGAPSGRRSLPSLGAALAASLGDKDALSDPARRALEDIEAALGVDTDEILAELAERPEAPPPPTERYLDVDALAGLLDGRHAALRDKIRTLLSDRAFRYRPELGTAAYREQVLEWCELLAEQGLGALAFPEAYGGEGDMERFIVAFETIAYHDLSLLIKFGVQFGLFAGSIQRLGTERHHDQYLERTGTLDLPGCFAMSEQAHGSNVRDLETVARYDPDAEEFVVNTPHDGARKEWIGNAAVHGQLATVFAQLETQGERYGVHAFLVPIRTPDGTARPRVRIADCGEKMGLNGVDNGRLWFDHVRIPRENLLDRFGSVAPDGTYESPIPSAGKRFFTMLGTLVGGRISVARAAVSAAKSGLTIAIRYGNRRRQFGPKDEPEVPILDYRTHQRRLLPRLANAYALHFALDDLTQRFASRLATEPLDDIEAEANALKALATWNATDTLQTAREACGGQGYLAENRIARLKADTDVFTTFEGDNTVLLLQVAKGLLSDFRREFRDMNVFGMVQFVADEVATRLAELNPIVTRQTSREHLRSASFQQAAFAFRADALLQSAARRLQDRIQGGMDPFDAFVACQDHLLTLGVAHAKRITLDRFVDAIERVDDAQLSERLDAVRMLFALAQLEQDRGWFLEEGYFEGRKAKAIRGEVNALCGEIRPWAHDLVDAFAIPDACLAAPIAT
jgi:acyl-CoA oxidase